MEVVLLYIATVRRAILWLGAPAEFGLDHLFITILIPLGIHAAVATYIALMRSTEGS